MEENTELEQFQTFIDTVLIRNKSILDQITKLQDACARLNRTISKSATTCGCIKIHAHKQPYPSEDISLEDLNSLLSSHLDGYPCKQCNEAIEKEMGRVIFYLGCLANNLGISLSSVLECEKARTELLGKYSLN